MKAQSGIVFIAIILLVLALIIGLLTFQQNFFKMLEGKPDKIRCKTSVFTASQLRLNEYALLNEIDCCTQEHTVKTEKEVLPTVAKALYDCYDQFHKGEKSLFQGTGTYCHLCSTIRFEKSVKETGNLHDYLFTGLAKPRTTYAQAFLTQKQTPKESVFTLTTKPYAIVFLVLLFYIFLHLLTTFVQPSWFIPSVSNGTSATPLL